MNKMAVSYFRFPTASFFVVFSCCSIHLRKAAYTKLPLYERLNFFIRRHFKTLCSSFFCKDLQNLPGVIFPSHIFRFQTNHVMDTPTSSFVVRYLKNSSSQRNGGDLVSMNLTLHLNFTAMKNP